MIDDLRERIRAQYKPDFDFTRVEDVPFVRPAKPLAESRVALISTAGIHREDQEPFDRSTASGDSSFRGIRADDDPAQLRIWWDVDRQQPASQDINCAFPLPLLRELEAAGEIGSVAATHFSFSGSIPDPRPLIHDTGPEVARELRQDAVDAVLVAPS